MTFHILGVNRPGAYCPGVNYSHIWKILISYILTKPTSIGISSDLFISSQVQPVSLSSFKFIPQLEKTVYSTVKDFGYDGVVVFTPGTPKENVILTAISKYSKLKTTTHTVFNVIEVHFSNKLPFTLTILNVEGELMLNDAYFHSNFDSNKHLCITLKKPLIEV